MRKRLPPTRPIPMLLERTFLLKLANGDVEEAVHYARELEQAGLENFLAQLTLGAHNMVEGKYAEADKVLSESLNGPLAQLSIGISRAWALYGSGRIDEALAVVDGLSGPDWFEVFKATHQAHLLFAAGRTAEALEAAESAYAIDQGAIRVVDAYARLLAANGRQQDALKAFSISLTAIPGPSQLDRTREMIASGAVIPPMLAIRLSACPRSYTDWAP
jgi:tetratricopeptide (TPR) repeat protein